MRNRYGFYTEAMEALGPVFESERRRGNSGKWDSGDIHETRPKWIMRFSLDIPALEAEFEFGDRIEVRDQRGGAIVLPAALATELSPWWVAPEARGGLGVGARRGGASGRLHRAPGSESKTPSPRT